MEVVLLEAGQSQRADFAALIALQPQAYMLAARVLRSSGEAEDVVQQAYVNAVRAARALPPPERLRPWFLRVVANAAKAHLRSEQRRLNREAAMVPRDAGALTAPQTELLEALRAAVDALDETHRLPIALCYEQGLSQGEAAEVLEIPERTLCDRLGAGLAILRQALARAGHAAAPAAVLAGLAHTAPPVPATLAAAIARLFSGPALTQATGAAAAAAKGGIAMKVIAGVIAAGVLASGTALFVGPSTPHLPPSAGLASPPAGTPAPANPYNGMQTREEVYEFTQKPAVKKEGDKWVITFASKGACDATVSILDKDGKVIRHLASGVLGVNAPHPFQQNSLAQKLEWDGLKDDFAKADAAGCKVRVGLGLRAVREKSNFDPYSAGDKVTFATDPEGNFYLSNGLKYGKDGKYLGRFYPPPSQDLEKCLASKQTAPFQHGGPVGPVLATQWGDKVAVLGPSGWAIRRARDQKDWNGDVFKTLGETEFAKLKVEKDAPLPPAIAAARAAATPPVKANPPSGGYARMAVNRSTDQLYVVGHLKPGGNPWGCSLYRVDGRTLEWDKSFLPGGEFKDISEVAIGPDGKIFARIGSCGYGQWITCVDPSGKRVDLGGDAVDLPLNNKWPDGKEIYMGFWPSKMFHGAKVLWTGVTGHSNIHERGLYVSPTGFIVAQMQTVDEAYAAKHGIKDPKNGTVSVWNPEGKLLTANAVGPAFNGHGVAMDRDGNICSARASRAEPAIRALDGLPNVKPDMFTFGGFGTIAKFRSTGEAKYEPQRLWTYSVCSQSHDCTCIQQERWDQDYWARTWYPARQLGSIMVLDANGNRLARLGKYGTREEEKDSALRFMWPTVVAVSDTAAYAMDYDGRSRLALSYAAEETVPAP